MVQGLCKPGGAHLSVIITVKEEGVSVLSGGHLEPYLMIDRYVMFGL